MIRVVSVEDHWTVSSGLKYSFRGDRCGISIESAQNIDNILSRDPRTFDVILLDLILPGTNPQDNLLVIKKNFPDKPVIIYTGEDRDFWELEMLKLGACSFICKNEDREFLKEAIKNAYEGVDNANERIIHIEKENTSPFVVWDSKIDQRDKEIIRMLAHDNDLKTIAGKFHVTPNAVTKILTKVKNLLKVKSSEAMIQILKKKI